MYPCHVSLHVMQQIKPTKHYIFRFMYYNVWVHNLEFELWIVLSFKLIKLVLARVVLGAVFGAYGRKEKRVLHQRQINEADWFLAL